jgi:hypothetical protein
MAMTERFRPDALAMLAIAAVVLIANSPSLLGLADANPLVTRSGLASSVAPRPLPGERAIDPNDGFTSQALGHRAALDWLHLQVPWWNPYEGTGAPLAGEMQSAALFPPTLLTAFSNGQLYEHVLLEMLAGLSTYLLLRRIALRRWASAAAAVAFALNGTFAWLAHAPVNAVAFMPMLLLGVELAYAASLAGDRGGWWLIAVAGTASVYAGFPEITYIGGLLAVSWFAWRGAGLGRARLASFGGKAAAGVIVGTLLGAPLLFPSIRYVADGWLGGHAGAAAGRTHLPAQALSQLVLPYVFGPIFAFGDPKLTLTGIWSHVGGFLSTSLLVLALIGLASRGRRGLRLLLLAWIVLGLARIYDKPPFLGEAIGVLPGMSHVAFYRYGFPAVELAVTVLAGIGLDEIAKAPLSIRRAAMAAAGALAIVAVAALGARPLAHQLRGGFDRHPYLAASAAWGAAVIVAVAATAVVRDPRLRIRVASFLVVADALVLFALPQASAPRSVEVDLAPVRFLQTHLGTSRFFTLGPLQPNYGSYFGIASLNVNDLPVPSAFASYVRTRLDNAVDPSVLVGNEGGGRPASAPSPARELLSNLPGYRAAAVAYVLTPLDEPLPQSRTTFTQVFRSPTTRIYRLAGAKPYFTASRACSVRPESREAAELSCPAATLLIRRETDLPGWRSKIDGRSARIQRVDGLFQGVTVPAGTHRVTFDYASPHVGWGWIAFAAGCAWLLLPLVSAGRRRETLEPFL